MKALTRGRCVSHQLLHTHLIRPARLCRLGAALSALTIAASGGAQVVFFESFETPAVTGLAENTMPNSATGVRWVGSTNGFGATNRGLYNKKVAWPATPQFDTPFGEQATTSTTPTPP